MKDKAGVLILRNENEDKFNVMVIGESHYQRMVFCDTVSSCGFNLIDSDYDDNVAATITASKANAVLVGFSQAPYLHEAHYYAKWQRKLAPRLMLPALLDRPAYESGTVS